MLPEDDAVYLDRTGVSIVLPQWHCLMAQCLGNTPFPKNLTIFFFLLLHFSLWEGIWSLIF